MHTSHGLPGGESRALGKVSPSEPTLGHIDGAKMESRDLPNHAGNWLAAWSQESSLVQPFPSRGYKTAVASQPGKVVGVGLDLRLSWQGNLVIHLLTARATLCTRGGRGRIREAR